MRPSAQLIAAILFSLLLLPPDGAKASTVLDQSYLVTNNSGLGTTALLFPSFRRAQTFTVGLAGTLVEVDVAVDPMSLFAGKSAILNLLSTVAGVPTSVLQTSPTVNSALVNGFMDFAVSLPVIVGEVLAFELVESNSGYFIFSSIPGTYPGGADFIINTDVGINSFTGVHRWRRRLPHIRGYRYFSGNSSPRRSPALRHRPRRVGSVWLAQEAESASSGLTKTTT
jgi:hypothetical protein